MKLPEFFVAEGAEMAEGCAIFGVLLQDMTREELLAVAAQGWNAYTKSMEQATKDMRMLHDLHKAARRVGCFT